jgi:hypothetical protein
MATNTALLSNAVNFLVRLGLNTTAADMDKGGVTPTVR